MIARLRKQEPFIVMLCGPSGSGKSRIGDALAESIKGDLRRPCRFVDADEYHTEKARRDAAHGRPMDDQYRKRWLGRILRDMENWKSDQYVYVFACSALKEWIRRALAEAGGEDFLMIWLNVRKRTLKRRLTKRDEEGNHFFPSSLLESQLEAVERPKRREEVVIVNASDDDMDAKLEELMKQVRQHYEKLQDSA